MLAWWDYFTHPARLSAPYYPRSHPLISRYIEPLTRNCTAEAQN